MKNEGKSYEGLLNRNPQDWSRRQVEMFVRLAWNLGFKGTPMVELLTRLKVPTAQGKPWNLQMAGNIYRSFNRRTVDEKVLDRMKKMLEAIEADATAQSELLFDETQTPVAVKDAVQRGRENLLNFMGDNGSGKTLTPVTLTQDTEFDTFYKEMKEIETSNLSQTTKMKALKSLWESSKTTRA